jgi:Ubiquitin family
LSVSSLMSIKDLKIMYLGKLGVTEVKIEDIRFFYSGKELKEDLFIYSYDIKDEMTVQAMIKKSS